jgi:putative addiction module antidote
MNKPLDSAKALKLIAIGNSTGVILPKDLLARLHVEQGDVLSLIEGKDGFEVRKSDPAFDAELSAMRDVMKRRRLALRELAK